MTTRTITLDKNKLIEYIKSAIGHSERQLFNDKRRRNKNKLSDEYFAEAEVNLTRLKNTLLWLGNHTEDTITINL